MTRNIYESLLQLAVVLPIIFLFLRKYDKENITKILVFGLIFVCYQILLNLPKHFGFLKIIKGSWNWNGKILGILFGVLCYFLFRHLFIDHDYFRLRQDKTYLKKASIVSLIVVICATIIWYIFGKSEFNLESLAFQLTLPGIDEEIMYRGILLGLLMSGLKGQVRFIGNPSLLISSILFGIIHALKMDEGFTPNFNLIYFLQTGLAGYAWGWVTIKSRSIVLAIASHNFSNFFGTLAMMIK
jgi:membrane protease YdiL (CAAX protease family)